MAEIKKFPIKTPWHDGNDCIMVNGEKVKIFYTAREVHEMEQSEEKANFYLEPYIPKTGIALMYGKYGTYKTPLVMHMARTTATGGELWGIQADPVPGPVLMIEFDSPEVAITDRLKPTIDPDSNLELLLFHRQVNLVNPKVYEDILIVEQLRQFHRERSYSVVFVDALRCAHDLPDKEAENVQIVYGGIRGIFPGAGLFLVHHNKKTRADDTEQMQDEGFSGSQAWINQATVGIHVKHLNKKANTIQLQVTKSQLAEIPEPLELQAIDGGIEFKLLTESRDQVVADVVANLPHALAKEKDEAIRKELKCGLRTATGARLAWEKKQAAKASRPCKDVQV